MSFRAAGHCQRRCVLGPANGASRDLFLVGKGREYRNRFGRRQDRFL